MFFRDPKIIYLKTGVGHQIIFVILNMNGIHLTHSAVTLRTRFLAAILQSEQSMLSTQAVVTWGNIISDK